MNMDVLDNSTEIAIEHMYSVRESFPDRLQTVTRQEFSTLCQSCGNACGVYCNVIEVRAYVAHNTVPSVTKITVCRPCYDDQIKENLRLLTDKDYQEERKNLYPKEGRS